MKNLLNILLILGFVFVLSSCDDDEDNNVTGPEEQNLVSLESPYLICANRNPGGVGFDFVYKNSAGGGNYLDSLSVDDFDYDIMVRTIKAEKPDGSLGGMPHIALAGDAQAINYSTVDPTCKGLTKFQSLKADDLGNLNFQSDPDDFCLSDLQTGDTGQPLMSVVQQEYNKLVVGLKWKSSANNDVDGDELVWIIKTSENCLVKMIVTDFPADPAPTATGYIALEWDLLN